VVGLEDLPGAGARTATRDGAPFNFVKQGKQDTSAAGRHRRGLKPGEWDGAQSGSARKGIAERTYLQHMYYCIASAPSQGLKTNTLYEAQAMGKKITYWQGAGPCSCGCPIGVSSIIVALVWFLKLRKQIHVPELLRRTREKCKCRSRFSLGQTITGHGRACRFQGGCARRVYHLFTSWSTAHEGLGG
jgi:hypothetical protein